MASGLLRRWLVYYDVTPAAVRLISLQAICWPLTRITLSVVGWDQPVLGWLVCGVSAAFSNTVQLWVTSNIKVPSKDKMAPWTRGVPMLRSSPALKTSSPRVLSRDEVVLKTVFPLIALLFLTTSTLLWQQFLLRYTMSPPSSLLRISRPPSSAASLPFPLASTSTPAATASSALVIVMSSWTERSTRNRALFRDSSAQFFKNASTPCSVSYRFVLGNAPSPQAQARHAGKIIQEMETFKDMIVLPVADGYKDLSKKLYGSLIWADDYGFDYLVKTDDDMFVRFDVVLQELAALGTRRLYWRGLAYW